MISVSPQCLLSIFSVVSKVARGSEGKLRYPYGNQTGKSELYGVPLKGFFMFKRITLADAVSVVLGVLSTSSQTFSAIALPAAPKRTNFPWWFCPLNNPQEQPLINGWQAWWYKCSHHFPLMNNAEMWPSPSSNHLCFVLLPYLVLFSLSRPTS